MDRNPFYDNIERYNFDYNNKQKKTEDKPVVDKQRSNKRLVPITKEMLKQPDGSEVFGC